ncbi:1520_t:CDS:2, partial [Ambispora gerdemannii]
ALFIYSMSHFRERYFNVNKLFELSIEEFNKEWIFVDNIWTRFNGNKLLNGDEWKTYVCRLSKPQKSSECKDDVPPEKLPKKVRIEKAKDSPDHSHPLDYNDMQKRS